MIVQRRVRVLQILLGQPIAVGAGPEVVFHARDLPQQLGDVRHTRLKHGIVAALTLPYPVDRRQLFGRCGIRQIIAQVRQRARRLARGAGAAQKFDVGDVLRFQRVRHLEAPVVARDEHGDGFVFVLRQPAFQRARHRLDLLLRRKATCVEVDVFRRIGRVWLRIAARRRLDVWLG